MQNFEIRDARKCHWFWANDAIFDYLPQIGELGFVAYCLLAKYARGGSQAFPSYTTLATTLKITPRTAIKVINKLQKFGLISIQKRSSKYTSNETNVYTLLAIKPLQDDSDNSMFTNDPVITSPSINSNDFTDISNVTNESTSQKSSFTNDPSFTRIIKEEENNKREISEHSSSVASLSQENFVPSQEKTIDRATNTNLGEGINTISRQESTNSVKPTTPKKPSIKPKLPSDARSSHPAILAIRELIGRPEFDS